jgi:hypothetical protein
MVFNYPSEQKSREKYSSKAISSSPLVTNLQTEQLTNTLTVNGIGETLSNVAPVGLASTLLLASSNPLRSG